MSPQGLIFDFDGTLADTMPWHWQAWQVLMQRHGFVFTEERFYQLGGVPSREILARLKREQGGTFDPLTVADEKAQVYLEFLEHVQPIETIVAIAREHFGRLPLAVATGGTHDVIETVLRHLGIHSLFQTVVTSEDVLHPKPAPDVFLEAARRIGITPERCRAYEDTDLGLEAIQAAGMEAVDVRVLLAAMEPTR